MAMSAIEHRGWGGSKSVYAAAGRPGKGDGQEAIARARGLRAAPRMLGARPGCHRPRHRIIDSLCLSVWPSESG